MEEDRENGMYPFFVSATLGTTGIGAFDNLEEIGTCTKRIIFTDLGMVSMVSGPVCKEYDAWFHVDGAYGGNALICPEFRYLMKGIEVWLIGMLDQLSNFNDSFHYCSMPNPST